MLTLIIPSPGEKAMALSITQVMAWRIRRMSHVQEMPPAMRATMVMPFTVARGLPLTADHFDDFRHVAGLFRQRHGVAGNAVGIEHVIQPLLQLLRIVADGAGKFHALFLARLLRLGVAQQFGKADDGGEWRAQFMACGSKYHLRLLWRVAGVLLLPASAPA